LYIHSTTVNVPDPPGTKKPRFLEWTYNQQLSNSMATKRGSSNDTTFSVP
jgi:hypothetical protein